MHILKTALDSLAVNVLLGTLPLLFAIVWSLLQNDKRFARIETKLDSIEARTIVISERLVKVETRLEGGPLVFSSR